MKKLLMILVRSSRRFALFGVLLGCGANIVNITLGADMTQPHATLVAEMRSLPLQGQLTTGWIGFPGWGVGVEVNLGGAIGGTAATVAMNGSGYLRYLEYPGTGSLSFPDGAGQATMDLGFQTWAKYRVTFVGLTHDGDLPLLPDIANTDLRFADEQPFASYLLGGKVTLSDTIDDVQVVSIPAADSADFGLPPGLFDLSVGISLTPTLSCNLAGVELETDDGAVYSTQDVLNINLNSPSITVSGITQTTHCDWVAALSPNGTIEVSIIGLWDHTSTLPTGLNFPIRLASADISTSPEESIVFNLGSSSGQPLNPNITAVNPQALPSLVLPQTQRITILGSGFSESSTLVFNDGTVTYPPKSPAFISSYELKYEIAVGTQAARWTVAVVNGGVQSAPYPFYVVRDGNTTAPDPPIGLSVTPSSWGKANQFTLDWTNPSDPSGIVKVWWKIGSPPTSPSDGLSYRLPAYKPLPVSLSVSEGTELIYVWLEDGAGNKNDQNYASAALHLDVTRPTISITGPTSNLYYSVSQSSIVLSGNYGDNLSGVANVTWLNSAGGSGTASQTGSPLNGTWSTTPIPLYSGNNTLTAMARDQAGNTASAVILVNRTDTSNSGTVSVTINPAGAVAAGAQWRVNGGHPHNSGDSELNVPTGPRFVEFLAIPGGWRTPAGVVLNVTAGQTVTATSTYTPVVVKLPPNVPTNPIPANGANSLSRVNPSFSWTGGDSDDPEEYAFFLSTNPSPDILNSLEVVGYGGVSGSSVQITRVLLPATTYYWKVDARDAVTGVIVESPVWAFTTEYSYADLVPTSLSLDGNVEPGSSVTLSATIKNNGTFTSPVSYVYFYLSREPGNREIRLNPNFSLTINPPLAPGEERTFTYSATLDKLQAGQSFIDVWIDSTFAGPNGESNFDNNTRTIGINYIDGKPPQVTYLGLQNSFVKTATASMIVYTATDDIGIKTMDFYYSTDGGVTWTPISEGYVPPSPPTYGATYGWTIPPGLPVGGNLTVRAVARDTSGNWGELVAGPYVVHDSTVPTVTVVSPNGGEVWDMGSTHDLTWAVSGTTPISEVVIEFLHDTTVEFITSLRPPTSTSFSWTFSPTLATTTATIRIRAVDTNGNEAVDVSDGYFTLRDPSKPPPPPWSIPEVLPWSSGDAPRIATDSLGTVHMVYSTASGYQYRKKVGTAWTSPIGVNTGSDPVGNMAIAADSLGRPHLVWNSSHSGPLTELNKDDIFYTLLDGGTWAPPINLSSSIPGIKGVQTRSEYPALCVDLNNTVHAVWGDGYYYNADNSVTGSDAIYYSRRDSTSGQWSSVVQIVKENTSFPAIVADSVNSLHVACAGIIDGVQGVFYANNTSGTWSPPARLGAFLTDRLNLVVGQNDTLHVAWRARNDAGTKGQVRYRQYSSESWSDEELAYEGSGVADSYLIPFLVCDSLSRAHLIVEDWAYPKGVFYRARISPGWSTVTKLNYDSLQPVDYSTSAALALTSDELNVVWVSNGAITYNHANVGSATDIFPPSVFAISPAPGSVLAIGSAVNLQWNATDNIGVTAVDLHYSTDGGSSWILIAANQPNSGSYSWAVPNLGLNLGQVRITAYDAAGNTGTGFSGSFTTADLTPPSIVLLAPTSGTTLVGNGSVNVNWSATDNAAVSTVDLEYSLDNGSSWDGIVTGLANTGAYSWVVPDVATSTLLLRATARDTAGFSATAQSAQPLTIVHENTPPITPHSPFPLSGGGAVPPGSGVLQWSSGDVDGDSLTYQLRFGTDSTPPIVAAGLQAPSVNLSSLAAKLPQGRIGLSSLPTSPEFSAGKLLPQTTYHWQVTASDGQASSPGPDWSFTTSASSVLARHVFYNNSAFDGNDPTANANDDNAIAPDKVALFPGQTATFNNYTSYSKGINGIMVDISGLGGTPTTDDFIFKVGNDNNPAGWSSVVGVPSITVRSAAGVDGSERMTIIWTDNNLDAIVDPNEAVANAWLEVTVKATANTGLAADDVFYFGNAVGECGNSAANAVVDVSDILLPFNHQSGGASVGIAYPYDINRDKFVDITDILLPFNHQTGAGTPLRLIDLSGGSSSSLASGAAAESRNVLMSVGELSALLAGDLTGLPGSSGAVGRIAATARGQSGTWRLFIQAPDRAEGWVLKTTEDLGDSHWETLELPVSLTPEGCGWFLEIPSGARCRFYQAVQPSSSHP